MKRHCIIFILISCAFILTACNSSPVPENKNLPETSTDFESIEVGTKREDGNYITEDTYGKLAEQYYADLQKKEASILWIECQHLEDLSKEEIYNLLKSSMDSFSLADI